MEMANQEHFLELKVIWLPKQFQNKNIKYAGSPPFSKASVNDSYYKLISNNKTETFQKFHAKHERNPNFFSQDSMNLFEEMVQPDQLQRLSLEQYQQHPWMNGPTNSLETIQIEFIKRNAFVDAVVEREKLRKQAERLMQTPQGQAVHNGVGNLRYYFKKFNATNLKLMSEWVNKYYYHHF